ncbi:MAG: copper-binding protein [Deltaproteobacteria bacterium]|nr:copper-binding protein [Deltaproteobacteria bacterium]
MSRSAIFVGLSMFLFVFASAVSVKAAEKRELKADLEMHHPKGWQFTMPKGDPSKGRAVFDKFSCYSCHEVREEKFPAPGGEAVGPELSQMGPLHPLEYFTESTINPSAVASKKYRGADGKSKMPSFNEDMTVQELIDLSTYLASLRPTGVPKFVTGEGKVIALVSGSHQVVVEHGEIKGFMDAMTMGYPVDAKLIKGLKPGDMIRFTIDTEKRAITKIVKLKN